jgi:hypothetical protein
MQQPVPLDELVKRIQTVGDDALAEASAQIKGAGASATVAALTRLHGAADAHNPLKNAVDSATFAAQAAGPLQKVREELHGNFIKMHDKAEEEADEVLTKVKNSIHNATYTAVEAAVEKIEKIHEDGYVKESLWHAANDVDHSHDLDDKAMKAVQLTMDAIAKVEKASDSLPKDEIEEATAASIKAQKTAAMFTKQALDTKQIVEQYMEVDYQSHHNVVLADIDQGNATKIAHEAEAQAATNSADIKVVKAAIQEAHEEATQSLQKTSRIGSMVLEHSAPIDN